MADFNSSCDGKEAFSDPQLARSVLSRMKRRAKAKKLHGFGSRDVYRCAVCHQWHLGRSNWDIKL